MNEAMKDWVQASDAVWSATIPLVLFMTFFVGMLLWTWLRAEVPPHLPGAADDDADSEPSARPVALATGVEGNL